MGHCNSILRFEVSKYNTDNIQTVCDEWADMHADAMERGNVKKGLGSKINFTSMVFDSEHAAEEYLFSTLGDYRQIAVRVKVYKNVPASKTYKDLDRRCDEYKARIEELNKPHYAGVQSNTVKCKQCGSVLATAYCGKTWNNNCPVCKAEMRPATTIEKLQTYKIKLSELQGELRKEITKQNQKMEKQAVLYWFVMCEVHC